MERWSLDYELEARRDAAGAAGGRGAHEPGAAVEGERNVTTRVVPAPTTDGAEVSHPREGVAVVALCGNQDLLNAEQLRALLAHLISGSGLVVVDLSGAEFVDSTFLHNLVDADELATRRGSRLVLQVGAAPSVRAILELSGLGRQLDCAGTRDEALARNGIR